MSIITMEHQSIGRLPMYIGDQWIESANGKWIEVEDPGCKGNVAGYVPRATAEDVDRAVRVAAEAYPSWKTIPARERGRVMFKIGQDLAERADLIGRTIALENGNAIRTQSRPEASLSADIFTYFGGVSGELKGETIPFGEHAFSYTRREPLGVVGAIVPWNSPVLLAALKIAMALTAGNTMVLKASAEAPLAVARMVEACVAHLPPGVLNLVSGPGSECGAYLADHPGLAKLSFTGSTSVGRSIFHAAAEKIVPVSLELGGKSPQIVFPDANDDQTVQNVINGMRFSRQGQSCTAGSRLLLHESIFDSFLDKLAARLKTFKVGDPLDESSDAGAMVNRTQFDKVCGYIREGLDQAGAKLVMGGLPPDEGPLSEGYYIEPTIFAGVGHDWRITREEVFGPVLVAIPWSDEAEALRMANDSHYGLAAFIHTRDITKGLRAAHAIESGFVQINQALGQWPGHSYGGFKQSGIGREFSLEGMLDSFTQRKSVTINLEF